MGRSSICQQPMGVSSKAIIKVLRREDIAMAFGYAPQPPGPWSPAEGLAPFTLRPGQAADLTLIWAWAGEPYASLRVGVYQYAVQFQ